MCIFGKNRRFMSAHNVIKEVVNMSVLSSMAHGEVHDLPNEVHNIAEPDTVEYSKTLLTAEATRRKAALLEGVLRPLLYYSEEVQLVTDNGETLYEPPHTVESKLEQKEEKPLG